VGPRAVLDEVVKRKIPSPRRESNPGTPIVQPVELSRLLDRTIDGTKKSVRMYTMFTGKQKIRDQHFISVN
jgi:hypothetical protein